jgi:hypothetical protein
MNKILTMAMSGIALLFSWTACHDGNNDLLEQKYSLHCSQDSTFYYYTVDYGRIYLVVSDYCITIKFSSPVSVEYLDKLEVENEQLDSVAWIRKSDCLAYGYLKTDLSCEDIEELLINLIEEDLIICTNPNFYLRETVDGGRPVDNFQDLMGLTDEFLVSPKEGVPWSVLESLLNTTHTRLVRTGPFYLVLSADKNSAGNSLEMSKFFYETGYFDFSHPNFLVNLVLY